MLALFHSNEFEIDGVKYPLKIIGNTEKPWFKANDVCKALGYLHPRNALKQRVKSAADKKSLNDIITEQGVGESVTPEFRRNYEGQNTYISEPGVYALIFGSKLPSADKFRTWVFNDVLPSIRRDGQYKLTRELEDAKQAIEDERKEKETAIESLKSKLDLESKKALHLKQMILNEKARTPDQIVYIATTRTYAANNLFKVGVRKKMNFI